MLAEIIAANHDRDAAIGDPDEAADLDTAINEGLDVESDALEKDIRATHGDVPGVDDLVVASLHEMAVAAGEAADSGPVLGPVEQAEVTGAASEAAALDAPASACQCLDLWNASVLQTLAACAFLESEQCRKPAESKHVALLWSQTAGLQWVAWDDPSAFVGRPTRLDEAGRVVYAPPGAKTDFTEMIHTGDLRILIPNTTVKMQRQSGPFRPEMPADIRVACSLHQALLQRAGDPPALCDACGKLTESLLCPLCRHARHQRCVELLPRETLTLAIQHIQDSQRIQACFDVLDRSSSPIAEEELFCDWCSALFAADP